ncbi:MAG: cysteine hydrolase [Ruminococcaceae bacterium]|nr:cysteine hydrolase [Oscillospiraceae bacterium]
MKHFLVVVDIQNDFVDGALGTPEAQAIIDSCVKKIEDFDGEIFVTYDTHSENYLETAEGKKLAVTHCVKGTHGWLLNERIENALKDKEYTPVEKPTFGSIKLPLLIKEQAQDSDFDITLIGICTDICVVSNALILKAHFSEKEIYVDSKCCAGVTPATHNCALDTMRCCQINVV